MKDLVYSTPVQSLEDLVTRIAAAVKELHEKPGLFDNIRQDLVRCGKCIEVRGQHFEHLL